MGVESFEPPMSRTPSWSAPRSFVCSVLAVALATAPSLPVLAAAPEAPAEGDPEALSAAAVERFEAKDYDGAAALFEQAYAADPNPNYLFNIGRVYEEKGDLKNAVVYYQRFVGEPGVDIESRQTATERLKVLRDALAQLEGDEPPEDDGTEPEVDPATTDAGKADEKAKKRKKALRISGYTLLGVGGVGLVLGGVFGGLASGSVKDAEGDPFVDRQEAFRDRARTQARTADAMFFAGGALAAVGLVLVLVTLGGKNKKTTADVSRKATWSPVVGPQQVGLGLTRRF
jgi:tetratricopeptide (TPR) repeat protein